MLALARCHYPNDPPRNEYMAIVRRLRDEPRRREAAAQ
jgi:hypothetical protein